MDLTQTAVPSSWIKLSLAQVGHEVTQPVCVPHERLRQNFIPPRVSTEWYWQVGQMLRTILCVRQPGLAQIPVIGLNDDSLQ